MNSIKSMFYYFFAPVPGSQFKFYIPLIILIVVLIAGGIAFSIFYKKKKKEDLAFKRLFKNTSKRMILFGILFLVLIMSRYQRIPYFSMRILIYVALTALIFFTYKTVKTAKIDYPESISRKKSNKKTNKQYTATKKKR